MQGPLTSTEWQLPNDPTGLQITFQRHKVSFKEMQEAAINISCCQPLMTFVWLKPYITQTVQLKPLTPSFLSGMVPLFMHTSRKPIKLGGFYVYVNKHWWRGVFSENSQKSGLQGCPCSFVGIGNMKDPQCLTQEWVVKHRAAATRHSASSLSHQSHNADGFPGEYHCPWPSLIPITEAIPGDLRERSGNVKGNGNEGDFRAHEWEWRTSPGIKAARLPVTEEHE